MRTDIHKHARRHRDQHTEITVCMVKIVEADTDSGAGWWTVQRQKGPLDDPSDDSTPTFSAYWADPDTDPKTDTVFYAFKVYPTQQWALGARACANIE